MLSMKVFGNVDMTWRGHWSDDAEHVLVATTGANWKFLCCALPSEYETVDPKPEPTTEPVVWKHDRKKVTCEGCLAVLDGAVVERKDLS